MSLFIRRIFFYLLLGAFVIVTPLLIAYTSGYRYNFKQGRLVKTGALSLTSIPDQANIILNGKLLNDQTPALLINIMPGNYTISLQREGYYTWHKTLAVASEKTTFAHNVPLFKKSTPEFISGSSGSSASSTEAELPNDEFPNDLKQFKIFYDKKLDKIIVVDNDQQSRLTELEGNNAIWREKETPLLFTYSEHEVWQYDPLQKSAILITRLIENIQQIIPIPKIDAIILVFKDHLQAFDLDPRDQQNFWDLAKFDNIKNATLMDDGKTLQILGTYQGKEGMWTLKLQ